MEPVLGNRVAIVTGAARGIGGATVQLLSEHGARVMLADVDKTEAEKTASAMPGETAVFGGDLARPGAPEALVEAAVTKWGTPDIIVNCAGYNLDSPLIDMSDEDWHQLMTIHAYVPFAIMRSAGRHMIAAAEREKEQGVEVFRKVVNISSMAAMGSIGQANYTAAKSAAMGLTRTAAKEWAPHRINVNSVSPGTIATRLWNPPDENNILEVSGRKIQLGLPPEMTEWAEQTLPLGRLGTAEEVAGSIFILCSPWSDHITGQNLNVNGGFAYGMQS